MTDEQIKYMVNRFLGWKLPANFSPDAGISYTRPNYAPQVDATPYGTNLFDATQAEAMVRYMVEGLSTHAQSPAPTAAEIYEQCLQCVRSFGPTDDKTRNGIAGIIEHFKGLYERDFGFATPQPAQSDVVREAVRYAIGSLERDIIHKAAQISACDPRQDIYIRNLSAQKATLEAHLAALSAPRPAPEGDNPTGKQSLQVADVDPNDVWEAYLDETDNPSPQGAIAFAVNFMLHDESQEVDRQ